LARRSKHDWEAVIRRLKRNEGRWILALPDVPIATVKLVRLRRNPALRTLPKGSSIDIDTVNVYGPRGHQRGDVYLRYRANAPQGP
jgi:hypothetical protein